MLPRSCRGIFCDIINNIILISFLTIAATVNRYLTVREEEANTEPIWLGLLFSLAACLTRNTWHNAGLFYFYIR